MINGNVFGFYWEDYFRTGKLTHTETRIGSLRYVSVGEFWRNIIDSMTMTTRFIAAIRIVNIKVF
jgi:hypothetical protein